MMISCGGGSGGGGSTQETQKSSTHYVTSSSTSSSNATSSAPAQLLFKKNTISSITQGRQIVNIREIKDHLIILHSRDVRGDANDTEFISLVNSETNKVLGELPIQNWIHYIHAEDSYLYTFDFNSTFTAYKINELNEKTFEIVSQFTTPKASPNSSINFIEGKNVILIYDQGNVFSLKYSESSFFDFKELPTKLPNFYTLRWDTNDSKLYVWMERGKISEYAIELDGSITWTADISFTPNPVLINVPWFKISHNGNVLVTLDHTIQSFKRQQANSFERIDSIENSDFEDWADSFEMTQSGEALAQWQTGRSKVKGQFKYFEVDSEANIKEFSQSDCPYHNGFSSFRNSYYSNKLSKFLGGGPSLIEYVKENNSVKCQIRTDFSGITGLNGIINSTTNKNSIFTFTIDSDTQAISTFSKKNGDLILVSQYSLLGELKDFEYPKKLILAPGNKHLYLVTDDAIHLFLVNEDGSVIPEGRRVDIVNTNNSDGVENTSTSIFSEDGKAMYVIESRRFSFLTHYEVTPVVAHYSRDTTTGSLLLESSITLSDEYVTDARIENIGPIAISPDGKFLYTITKFWGIMNVFDLSNSGFPNLLGSYVDPYMFAGDNSIPNDAKLDGISDASDLIFSENGDSMFMTIKGYPGLLPNIFKGEFTDLTLVNLTRNTITGELSLRENIKSQLSGASAYSSPLIRDNYLYVVSSPYVYGNEKSKGVDVYQIDELGYIHFQEKLTDSFFGEGISEIKLWHDGNEIMGSNNFQKTITTISLY